MIQERRITDRHPDQPLQWDDQATASPSQSVSSELAKRLRNQAAMPFGPEGFALLTEAADELDRLAAPVAAATEQATIDAENLIATAQQLREVKHWAAQASVPLLAEIAGRMLKSAPLATPADAERATLLDALRKIRLMAYNAPQTAQWISEAFHIADAAINGIATPAPAERDAIRDQALLEDAAKVALKFTAVPRDVLGPATVQMKTLANVGEKIAAAIRALPQAALPDGYMLVRKPEWAKAKEGEPGEFVCCGGYTPCRGECAAFERAADAAETRDAKGGDHA